jgi:hypothetical protein
LQVEGKLLGEFLGLGGVLTLWRLAITEFAWYHNGAKKLLILGLASIALPGSNWRGNFLGFWQRVVLAEI